MLIAISNELILLVIGVFLLWLLLRALIVPRARRAVVSATGPAVAAKAVRLAVTSTIATILGAMVAAAALVGVSALLFSWYLASLPAAVSLIETVSQVRGHVEQGVDLLAGGSTTTWIASLTLLALTWLLLSRSSSRRRWNEALAARRSALGAALASVSDDELRDRAAKADAAGLQSLEGRLETLRKDNMASVEQVMAKPVLQFGNDASKVASMFDLLGISQQMRQEADELEASASEPDKVSGLRETAAALSAKFDEIADEITVTLNQFDGKPATHTLV